MNFTNRMVSSDNMGYASYLLEQDKNFGELPGQVMWKIQVASISFLFLNIQYYTLSRIYMCCKWHDSNVYST